ncbi:MAG: lipoate--protein ligase [Solobacterium sp.]|nr:lipoate--protein ligase [Solobacterium sp.]
MIKHLYTVSAAGNDPLVNLAAESALMETAQKDALIFYLWQNDNTIVIGRNQNLYKECSLINAERDHVHIVRRPSGGGAVYHDRGNLNFTFITDDENFDTKRQSNIIVSALQKAGLKTELSGRNDLLIDGRKFSGNAYWRHNGFSYHHGTLLVSSDLSKMPLYLKPDPLKLKANSVNSVKSRVTNLSEYARDLDIASLSKLLILAAEKEYGCDGEEISFPKGEVFAKYYDLYSSKDWIFGKNPPFDLCFEKRFGWGGIELCFFVKNGRIEECAVYSDSLKPAEIETIPVLLKHCSFAKESVTKRLALMESSEIKEDLIAWLSTKEF